VALTCEFVNNKKMGEVASFPERRPLQGRTTAVGEIDSDNDKLLKKEARNEIGE
jgi:hypothetical protein